MQSQMYVPPLTKINKIIIIAYVALFLLNTVLEKTSGLNLVNFLGLSAAGIKSGYIFQLFTYPFIDNGLISVVFNALMIWFIGSELESKWGRHFYLKFLAISTYSFGIIFALASLVFSNIGNFPFHGITGTNMALLVAYGIIYAERTMIFMFIFPMKAKYFTLILAAMSLFMAMTSTFSSNALFHLVAMIIGFLYLKYISMKARGMTFNDIKKSYEKKQRRQKLSLVKDEDDTKPSKADPKNPKFWQ